MAFSLTEHPTTTPFPLSSIPPVSAPPPGHTLTLDLPGIATSALRWGSDTTFAVSCWDGAIRVVSSTGTSLGLFSGRAPVLSLCWRGNSVAGGDASGQVVLWDEVGSPLLVGSHAAPVKCLAGVPNNDSLILSAGWDSTAYLWDIRSKTYANSFTLDGKAFCMDCVGPNSAVVGTSKGSICILNFSGTVTTNPCPLKTQLNALASFSVGAGFAVGAIEGRTSICVMDESRTAMVLQGSFSFKCHRESQFIYTVNDIHFHPNGTFSTCGSDGTVSFWDKDHKQRLRAFPKQRLPVVAGQFSPDGLSFAYVTCYDFSLGAAPAFDAMGSQVFVQQVQPDDVTSRRRR